MENKGLTLSIIFEADSANYGEGYGNVSALKRISRADGNSYTYISRQALIFSLKNNLGWLDTETAAQGKVAQYTWDSNIKESPEIDLFGYMKTKSKNKDKKGTEDEGENKKGEQSTAYRCNITTSITNGASHSMTVDVVTQKARTGIYKHENNPKKFL